MAAYHFAGIAIALGIGGLLAAFSTGYLGALFGAAPTELTEVILVVAVIAAFGLMIGSIAAEGEGRRRFGTRGVVGRIRRSQLAAFRAGHVAWFTVAFVLVVLVALGADAWATVYQGADPVSAAIVGLLVFLLTLFVAIVIFGAMRVKERFSTRK
jgi:hypothetical protein